MCAHIKMEPRKAIYKEVKKKLTILTIEIFLLKIKNDEKKKMK